MATLICRLQINDSVTGVVKMSKCRCGIGLDNANVFEIFLGAGPKLYKYESRVSIYVEFRTLPFEIC